MKAAIEIWKGAKPNEPLLEDYLKFMGIEPAEYAGVGLRLHPDLRCDVQHKKLPAVVACLVTPANTLAAIHCTYIMDSWKTLQHTTEAEVPAIGSSVRLFPTAGEDSLIIATGIETALAVRATLYREGGNLFPCWATLNANTMKYLVVPETITKVIIAVDNDVDYNSQRAGYALANRLMVQGGGRKVRVMTPDKVASNFNDQLRHVDNG